MTKSTSRLLKILFLAAIIAGLAITVVSIGIEDILRSLGSIKPVALLAASTLFLASLLANTIRWRVISPASAPGRIPFMFAVFLSGVFGNVITPGARFGGEPFKAFYMKGRYGGLFSDHLSVILLDKTSNGITFISFVIGSLAVLCWNRVNALVAIPVALAAFIPMLLLVFSGKADLGPLRRLLGKTASAIAKARWMRKLFRIKRSEADFRQAADTRIAGFFEPLQQLKPGKAVAVFLLSGVYWLLCCLSNWVLFASIGLPLSYPAVIVIMTLSTFVSDLSTTPAGLGFVETAMMGTLSMYNISPEQAMAATVVSRAVNLAVSLGVGGAITLALTASYGRMEKSGGPGPVDAPVPESTP